MKLLSVISIMLFGSLLSTAQCDGFSMSVSGNNPTCYGFSDGSVITEITGGTSPFYIDITNEDGDIVNPEEAPVANTLFDGWYYVNVTDSEGCNLLDSIHLVYTGPLEVDVTTESCTDFCVGSIVVDTVYGYNGDYSQIGYYWVPNPTGENGIGENELIDLCGGAYDLIINDEAGCSASFSYVIDCFGSVENNEASLWNVVFDRGLKQLHIMNIDNVTKSTLDIIDLNGKVILSKPLNSGENRVEVEFISGLYLYIIKTNQKKVSTGKFVVTER